MVIEFSPGLRQSGEEFGPPEPKSPSKIKASYYEVGVFDAQGRRSGPVGPQWVIYSDGRIEGPGVWQGQCRKQTDGNMNVKIALIANGAQDEFTPDFTKDGFVAYKSGKPYRWGRLIRSQ